MTAPPNVAVGLSDPKPHVDIEVKDKGRCMQVTDSTPHGNTTMINSLPPEIIAESLRHALPSSVEDYTYTGSASQGENPRIVPNTPSVLATVCKHWRDIIFTTPNLWAVIPIIITKDRDPRQMAYALDLWLARSGILPLEVIIEVAKSGRRYWHLYQDDIEQIMASINKQSHRISVLKARGVYSWLKFLNLEGLAAQNLRRLEIIKPEADFASTDSNSVDSMDYSVSPDELRDDPRRRIRIGPLTEPTALVLEYWTVPQLGVGVDRLTHVALTHLKIAAVLDVLKTASRLVSCSVSHCIGLRGLQFPIAADATVMDHLSLRALDIRACTTTDSALIIQFMRLPRLESFRIHGFGGARFLMEFRDFLRRSASPPLEVLHFNEVLVRPTSVEDYITSIVQCVAPTLKDFAFRLSVDSGPMDVMRSHELVDAVFSTGVELPLLCLVALYGMEYRWSYTLLCLVRALSRTSAQTPPRIKLYILSESPETVTVNRVLALSCFDQSNAYPVVRHFWNSGVYDELSAISPAEILEMIGLMDRHSLSFSVYIDSQCSGMTEDVDIFPEMRTRLLDMCNM